MGLLTDGSAVCDRCATVLPGLGVLYGLCVDTDTSQLIFCYVNSCNLTVTQGLINFPGASVCSNTGQPITRTTGEALIAADLDPADQTQVRQLAFCYTYGCADLLLSQMEIA